MLCSFPFYIVDELNHSSMPELNIRHQRFVLLRANPIVVGLFGVALTQRIDECKLPHGPIFVFDGIFKRKRVRLIVVCIVDRMADPMPRVLIFAVIELHEPPANLSFFFAITLGGGPCKSSSRMSSLTVFCKNTKALEDLFVAAKSLHKRLEGPKKNR